MPQSRNPWFDCPRLGLAIAVAVCALTGGVTGPRASAQAPAGGPPQFLTWQITSRDSVETGPERVMARRTVRRPGFQSPTTAIDGAVDGGLVDVTEPATFLQSYTGMTFGETGSLPPDPSGAAGPTQFIVAANGRIRSLPGSPGGLSASLAAVKSCVARSVFAASPESRSTTPPFAYSAAPPALKPITVRPRVDVAIDGTQ